jgi:hypothetical protein
MSNINYKTPDFIQARFIETENEQENDTQNISQKYQNLEEVFEGSSC